MSRTKVATTVEPDTARAIYYSNEVVVHHQVPVLASHITSKPHSWKQGLRDASIPFEHKISTYNSENRQQQAMPADKNLALSPSQLPRVERPPLPNREHARAIACALQTLT
jgi:hypothetical protein